MSRIYPGIAFTNIKSNRKTYLPYIISAAVTVAFYYIVCSLGDNGNLLNIYGGDTISAYMGMGKIIVGIFAAIFLFYVNSFLIKRRQSEFGLYNILGMEKRHIAAVIFLENLYVFVPAAAGGIFCGILADKMMYLVAANLFGDGMPLGFYISSSGIRSSLVLFGIIFLLIFLSSCMKLHRTNPADLLRSRTEGEREPKSRWILALIGLIALAAGYFIAVTTENPISAFMLFFVAVLLVILGTYLLFTAGSITLLKLLRKNKSYYYKTNHFISVSSMMYRMKKNAVGLANICILSTMVIIMVSSVLSMFCSLEDSFERRYPTDVYVCAPDDDPHWNEVTDSIADAMKSEGLVRNNITSYRNLSVSASYDKANDRFITDTDEYSGVISVGSYDNLSALFFVPLEDYNECMGKDERLADGEVLFFSENANVKNGVINIFGNSYKVKKTLDSFMQTGNDLVNIVPSYCIVTNDIDEINRLQQKEYGKYASYLQREYMCDADGSYEDNKAAMIRVCDTVNGSIPDDFSGYTRFRAADEDSYGSGLTGLFFIGIFLGILFIMATILIIYYKQITEGYEDKDRFEILQNVGMSLQEVKRTINSQVLTVFFLPLIMAGIHVAFAFPFLFRIMALLQMFNLRIFAACTVATFLMFSLMYCIVYKLTTRLYYGIVRKSV